MEFRSLEEFLQKTRHIQGTSGLTFFETRDIRLYVGLFRNCICGSTLLVPCKDRRGSSPEAVRRREAFGRALEMLKRRGWSEAAARRELLHFVEGKESGLADGPPPRRPSTGPASLCR